MHSHAQEITRENEQKTLAVIIVTLVTMIAEIFYGYLTHSMALLADGYHMVSHVLALGLTYVAYILIRKFKNSELFPNGTDKIGTITAYTSALFLGLTGIWIITEAILRLVNPLVINFDSAILVAVIGLTVNCICIFIMEGKHHHHERDDDEHEDYNFKAAYYHILADALTSILAIFALLAGKFFNIISLDALIGILGGIMILRWAINLIKKTVIVLIDMKN